MWQTSPHCMEISPYLGSVTLKCGEAIFSAVCMGSVMKIAEQVGPLLPALRRYARALSGSQGSGDTYVRIMLETLITEPREWNTALAPKLAAFQLFHRVWGAVGQDFASAAPDSEGKFRVAADWLAGLAPPSRQAHLLTA